jgi:hypothetical protein
MTAVSGFWRGVDGRAAAAEAAIDAPTLEQAAIAAFERGDSGVAFRRNRELIDVAGRFRRFVHQGRPYVAKRLTAAAAAQEAAQASAVASLLRGNAPAIRAIVPLTVAIGQHAILVSPDLGTTLHEEPGPIRALIERGAIGALLRTLLDRGIVWEGMAPRNLVEEGGVLSLLDLEDVAMEPAPARSCSDLTLMKWELNWRHHDGAMEQIAAATAHLRRLEAPLDSFERAYVALTGRSLPAADIRELCSAVTLASETPCASGGDGWTPFEAGHFADDVLPPLLSVVYTLATARLRRERGEAAYADFLRESQEAVQQAVRDADGARRVAIPLTPVAAALVRLICRHLTGAAVLDEMLAELAALREATGLGAAFRRAAVLDRIVPAVAELVVRAAGLEGEVELLLRGSYGQAVVSRLSDVDFELSGPGWPDGARGVEEAVCEALALFGIEADGSAARPIESDLAADGTTRDLHEWSELRQPGSGAHAPGWLLQLFGDDPVSNWLAPSQYERAGLTPSPKNVWFRARALVARLAFAARLGRSATGEQLNALEPLLGTEAVVTLRSLVEQALDAYENGATLDDLLETDASITAAASAMGRRTMEYAR